jgi:hypothetical protein
LAVTVFKVFRVLQDQLVLRGLLASRVFKEIRGRLALLVLRVLRVFKAFRVFKEPLALLALLGRLALLALRVT